MGTRSFEYVLDLEQEIMRAVCLMGAEEITITRPNPITAPDVWRMKVSGDRVPHSESNHAGMLIQQTTAKDGSVLFTTSWT